MLAGVLMLLAALTLFVLNQREDAEAGSAADGALEQLQALLPNDPVPSEPSFPILPSDEIPEMTVTEIDGYGYIGYLSIPSLALELPVMSEWDYARLKIAPCRYYGGVYTDDLVIAAHNYKKHFGLLYTLKAGDLVLFTGMDGNTTVHEVAVIETLAPTEVLEMVESEYALSLYTCTYGGQNRVTVRCHRLEGDMRE